MSSRRLRSQDRFIKRPVPLGLLGNLMDRAGVARPYPRMPGDFPLGLLRDCLNEVSRRLEGEDDRERDEREVI